jgi:cytidylate kinase
MARRYTLFVLVAVLSARASEDEVVEAVGHNITLILGPPGGGKGTISKQMVHDFHFHHVSTGDVLREVSSETISSIELTPSLAAREERN